MATGKEKPGGAATQPGGDGPARLDGLPDQQHHTTAGAARQSPPTARGLPPGYTGPAVWRHTKGDQSVTILGPAGEHGGRLFFAIEESATAIPGDELTPPTIDLPPADPPPPTAAPVSAARAIRALLEGEQPNGTAPADLGGWSETYQALLDAHQTGGAAQVRKVFDALARDDPALARLLASDPGAGSTWADIAGAIGPVAWDWPGWLPRGFLSELVGESGCGKSIAALRLGACYLRGDPWPDGTPYQGKTGAIVWAEAEAAQALNVGRAQSWGLPLDRIISPLGDPFADIDLRNPEHLVALATTAKRPDVRAVIVDSLSGASGGREKADEMMPVVLGLAELARNTGKAVLLLHHLRKRGLFDVGDVITLDRVRGSTVIVQPARVVWAIDVPNVNEPDTRRLSVIKSNLGRFPDPVGFEIGDGGPVFGMAPQPPKQETQLDRAADLLRALLASGPVPSTDLEEEARGAGLSWDTVKRAKDRLGIVVKRDGKTGKWSWALPARVQV